jgi:hypothetical protein
MNSSSVDESICRLKSAASASSFARSPAAAVAVRRDELVGENILDEPQVLAAKRRVPILLELNEDLLVGSRGSSLGIARRDRRKDGKDDGKKTQEGVAPGHKLRSDQ